MTGGPVAVQEEGAMALRLVKRKAKKSPSPEPAGAAYLVVDAAGGVVEVGGWESLAVEAPPASLAAGRSDDPPLVRGIAALVEAARHAALPQARLVEVQTDKARIYALVAAPVAGAGAARGRLTVTIAETGDPQASAAEGKVIRQLGHDLRTPLTSISGAVELLQSGRLGGLQPQQEKVLGLMQKGVDGMVRVIDEATAPYHNDRRLAEELGAEVEEMLGGKGGGS
jgi:signal transduction histidine kinase